jgi:hypothetical protein
LGKKRAVKQQQQKDKCAHEGKLGKANITKGIKPIAIETKKPPTSGWGLKIIR